MPIVTIVEDVHLYIELDGEGAGPWFVLSNSIGTSTRLWDPIVSGLTTAGYRVLRYDTRGEGKSSTPPGPWSIGDLASDVVALLDHFDIQEAEIVGISLGGLTSMVLAASQPARVNHLVLANTAAKIGSPEDWYARASTVRSNGLSGIAEAVVGRWFTPGYSATHPHEFADAKEEFLRNDPSGYANLCESLAEADARGLLTQIQTPTLILSGSEDIPTPPEQMQELAASLNNSTFHLIKGAHLSILESPDDFLRLVLDHVGPSSTNRTISAS